MTNLTLPPLHVAVPTASLSIGLDRVGPVQAVAGEATPFGCNVADFGPGDANALPLPAVEPPVDPRWSRMTSDDLTRPSARKRTNAVAGRVAMMVFAVA